MKYAKGIHGRWLAKLNESNQAKRPKNRQKRCVVKPAPVYVITRRNKLAVSVKVY